MKIIKIIMTTAIFATLTFQVVQAGSSLLTGNSGSSGSLLSNGSGNSNTGTSLLRSYETEDTNTNNIFNSTGTKQSCYNDSFGNTVCN
jgi:hypothetical protein|tara:strand:- start:450 stop:713 length:264 start_codon:yes stop_codon:yes gene_type:complete